MHFEMRTQGSSRDQIMLEGLRLVLVLALGLTLAIVATVSLFVSALLRVLRDDAVELAMACPREMSSDACAASASTRMRRAFAIYAAFGLALVLLAAALTAWAPAAAGSGLPELKAFLNGCHTPKILQPSTLVAKAIGTTLVVASGLPIGREGPMVHIGAALAVCLSSVRCPQSHLLFEMRLPSAQRNWVGVGAAAGVAAAFNAPLGGILYSFEEVCSHWSSRMTWLSFVCSVTVVATIDLLTVASGGFFAGESIVKGLEAPSAEHGLHAFFIHGNFLWICVLGIAGGLVGASYNLMAFRLARMRKRVLRWRCLASRQKCARVAEAIIVGSLIFSLFYWRRVLTAVRRLSLCARPYPS